MGCLHTCTQHRHDPLPLLCPRLPRCSLWPLSAHGELREQFVQAGEKAAAKVAKAEAAAAAAAAATAEAETAAAGAASEAMAASEAWLPSSRRESRSTSYI